MRQIVLFRRILVFLKVHESDKEFSHHERALGFFDLTSHLLQDFNLLDHVCLHLVPEFMQVNILLPVNIVVGSRHLLVLVFSIFLEDLVALLSVHGEGVLVVVSCKHI